MILTYEQQLETHQHGTCKDPCRFCIENEQAVIHAEVLSALEGMLEAYAPNADKTAAREGEESLHSAVKDARAALAKAKRMS